MTGDVTTSLLASLRRQTVTDFAFYTASLLGIQGALVLSQMGAARLVGPAAFAPIRTAEAFLSVALLAAALGMPSIGARAAAGALGAGRREVLRKVLGIAGVTSFFGVIVLSVGALLGLFPPRMFMLAWCLVPMATSRTAQGVLLGLRRVRYMGAVVALLSLVTVAVNVSAIGWRGAGGWIAARIGTEVLLAAALVGLAVWGTRHPLDAESSSVPGLRWFLANGAAVSVSLVLRTAVDQAGLLALWRVHAPPAEIGEFGLMTVILGLALFAFGAAFNMALPGLVALRNRADAFRAHGTKLIQGAVVGSVVAAVVLGVIGPTVCVYVWPQYTQLPRLLLVGAVAIPFRAVTSACGSILLAADRVQLTALINAGVLGAAVALAVPLGLRFGAIGAVTGLVVTEAVAAVAYYLALRRAT